MVLPALNTLWNKVLVTLLVVVVYRVGTYLPLPFVGASSYGDLLASSASGSSGGLLGVVNAISGGALGRYSIFSLNVMPYILSSIVSQLFMASFVIDDKSGANVKLAISSYTKYLTIVFAVVQGLIMSMSMAKGDVLTMVSLPSCGQLLRHVVVTTTLVAGTSLLVWLGELITERGLGNGISVLIFVGIVSDLPRAIYSTVELGRVGAYSVVFILSVFVALSSLLVFVVFVEQSFRDIVVYYPRRQAGGVLRSQYISHIPIKLNMAGVIPAIFANSVMLVPMSVSSLNVVEWLRQIFNAFYFSPLLYHSTYFLLVVFFAFFYTSIVFNPSDIADNLRKAGGVVSGLRPGQATASYIKDVVDRLTFVGAIYVGFVCVFVDIGRVKYSIPFALGGTSILIVVNVVNEIINQVRMHTLSYRYDFAMAKVGIKGGVGQS